MELLEVHKIWDQAPHNAFTDLVHYNGVWFCGFREGETHMSADGQIRVICSMDGKDWQSIALMAWKNGDLRDAKFSITPSEELMLNAGVRFVEDNKTVGFKSVTWFSVDGKHWSQPFVCNTGHDTWRWSVTWHKGIAYSFGYGNQDKQGCLYHSQDGKSWKILKDKVFPDVQSYGNESSIVFLEDDSAYCLLRRDKANATAMLGMAKPPYKDWDWSDLGQRIGGPKMVRFANGKLLAALRLHNEIRTALCLIGTSDYSLLELLTLPSAGDTSYPGLVVKHGVAWISYYSSHEEKTSIYLAKVQISE